MLQEDLRHKIREFFILQTEIKKGIVILVNKWDIIDKDTNTTKKFEELIQKQIAPFTDIPILFISTLEKQRLLKGLETAIDVWKNRSQKISTSELNERMLEIIEKNPPPATKGKYIKIKYCTICFLQLLHPLLFFANLPQYIKEPYKRFLENKIREIYNFSGVPITIYIRKK